MNSKEFIIELKSSNLHNKLEIISIYKEFQIFQNILKKALIEFHSICEKNKILYQLAYGSLLGAIRDNGQIPWDYDVDIFVRFEDKDKLIDILKKELSKDFYIYCPEINENCRHVFIRLSPIGYKSEILHIDIFYLTGTPNNYKIRKKFIKEVKAISIKRYRKLVIIDYSTNKVRRYLKALFYKISTFNYNLKLNYVRFNSLCKQYSTSISEVCITADTYADLYEFDATKIWQTKIIQTDFGEVRISKYYEDILNTIYGDYNQVFALEVRVEELLENYKKLKNSLIREG